jgi:magnesium-transporting ATPase (P-type)
MIQYTSTMVAYYYFSMPSDWHYLYWDLIISSSLSVTMNLNKAADKLSIQRPTSSLISWSCLFSIMSAVLIQGVAQFGMVYMLTK